MKLHKITRKIKKDNKEYRVTVPASTKEEAIEIVKGFNEDVVVLDSKE